MVTPEEVSTQIADVSRYAATQRRSIGEKVDLGVIEDGINIVYGNYPYQRRVQYLPGQPKTLDWTTQPALALERICRGEGDRVSTHITPLAYAEDILGLREDLAAKVVDHLAVIRARQIYVPSFQEDK